MRPVETPVSEGRLLASARAGEEWARSELYARHAAHVLAVARSSFRGDCLAEDAAQETWLHVFRALPRFRGESAVRTWIHRIALNTACSVRRSRSRWTAHHRPMPDRLQAPSGEPPILLHETLRQAVTALPPGMRRVLVLYAEGYTHREIGLRLGISTGTSKSRLSRARRRLRETTPTPLESGSASLLA